MSSKTIKGKIGENKVSDVLEQIGDGSILHNDVTLTNATSGMTHQLDHVLIHPYGIFVVETKNYFGTILYDEETKAWHKVIRGKESKISSPLMQNKSHAISLRKAIKSKYPIVPVVVFVKENAPYIPDENVINLSDLSLFIESYPYQRLLTPAEIQDAAEMIRHASSVVSNKEHVENIRYYKQYQRELKAEITYALERGKCPYCQSPILSNGADYKCAKCTFRFKL